MPTDQFDESEMATVEFVPTREFAYSVERARLLHGRSDDARQLGFFVYSFVVECDGDASDVLKRAKQVLLIINEWCHEPNWPSLEEWSKLLPDWFVSACGPERTLEEYEMERQESLKLSGEESIARARGKRWSLSGFTGCLGPESRLDPTYRMWI